MSPRGILVSSSLFLALAVAHASADTLGTQLVVGGLNNPIDVMNAPGDNRYLYIVERGVTSGTGTGTADIKIFDTQTKTIATFATFSNVNDATEEGLLGLAFDPNFATNHKYYVNLSTGSGNGQQNILSLTASSYTSGGTGITATAADTITSWSNPYSQYHKAGWIGFSPRSGDGNNLYIMTGDGSLYPELNDPNGPVGQAQSQTSPLGKILRIHVDPTVANNYTVPSNNPFASDSTGKDKRIFASGLRNPFRASFDSGTGDMYLGDVGQDSREEINVQKASLPGGGNNYGWRYREGSIATPQPTSSESAAGATPIGGPLQGNETAPILEYQHAGITISNVNSTSGGTVVPLTGSQKDVALNPSLPTLIGNCVIGGYVYRGSALTSVIPDGTYFFADLEGDQYAPDGIDGQHSQINSMMYDDTTGAVSNLFDWTPFLNASGAIKPVGFGEDNNGELYIIDNGSASGSIPSSAGRILLIVDVPEPASVVLMAAGGLLVLRRKR